MTTCKRLSFHRIGLIRSFERQITNDSVKNLSRVEKLAGKDEVRQRQAQKFRQRIEEIKVKWEKNKQDF